MRKSILAVMWVLAIAMLVALPVGPVLADPPVAAKVKSAPGNEPPVPRAIPDLYPYWNFDPPKSPLFDMSKLTVSGDARVRYNYRNNGNFQPSGLGSSDNYVDQWARLGLNYAISQDVDTFFQMQYSKNWGANNSPTAANDANTLTGVGIRQAYILIRNLGVEGLSMKAGRQLIVMGNHRLFGHFDWNNVGFSHDGITLQYNQPTYELWGGWVRLSDLEANTANSSCGTGTTGCAGGAGVAGTNAGTYNADLLFARAAFKPMAGLSIEPLWVFLNNKTGFSTGNGAGGTNSTSLAHAPGQNRHTLGARAAYKQGMLDATAEYYWQTGSFSNINGSGQGLSINAQAFAAVVGATFKDVPMQPRVHLEFNYASGDNSRCTGAGTAGCGGNVNTFENLYPTNHILMGYADKMAWRNMVGYSAGAQVKPTAESHFELNYWIFQKANRQDFWYGANQASIDSATTATVNSSGSLFQELDGVYTLFFAQNKVAWQTGVSYLFAGAYQDQRLGGNDRAVDSIWGYTQLHVNF